MKSVEFIDLFNVLLRKYHAEIESYETLANISIRDLINKVAEARWTSTDDILDELCETVKKKNNDYSQDDDALSNFYQVEKYLNISAVQGVMVRLVDKIERARNLMNGKEQMVENESLVDTWLDTVAYIIIMNILIQDKEKNNGTN